MGENLLVVATELEYRLDFSARCLDENMYIRVQLSKPQGEDLSLVFHVLVD